MRYPVVHTTGCLDMIDDYFGWVFANIHAKNGSRMGSVQKDLLFWTEVFFSVQFFDSNMDIII